MIKKLVIINFVVWILGQMLVERFLVGSPFFIQYFGFAPYSTFLQFFIWQPFTYMFLHSTDQWMHIVFNMLTLWIFGTELQQRWGDRFFLLYYLVSGTGAAVIYLIGVLIYGLISGNFAPMLIPVIGASGAVFGVMLAYAIFFGDRTVYFMMMFPMKARVMVFIIGGIEVVSLLSAGPTGQVANLAHLGGLLSGFIFLRVWAYRKNRKSLSGPPRRGRKLRLVVDNEKKTDEEPKYWH
jgi:membrane associated rhomboid family serine protease